MSLDLFGSDDPTGAVTIDGTPYVGISNSPAAVPYADTYVQSNLITVGGVSGNTNPGETNVIGDFSAASANGAGSVVPTPQGSSWLDSVTKEFNNVATNLTAKNPKTGTSAADQLIAGMFGKSNPPPMNSNTNLANKSLNSITTMFHQLGFGGGGTTPPGVGASQQASQWGTALLIAGGALVVVFLVFRIGR